MASTAGSSRTASSIIAGAPAAMLLGGLEDELDVTRQGVAAAGEHFGRG